MMLYIDTNFVLALIALALGAMHVVHTRVHKESSTKMCYFVGMVVVVFSMLVMVISGYNMTTAYVMKNKMKSTMQHKAPPRMNPKMMQMMKKAAKPMKDANEFSSEKKAKGPASSR